MTRAYLRLDPSFDERKCHYPDGPYAAFIACLCLGETQPERGRFRSVRYLKALLDQRGRNVQFLIDHKDLIVGKDGRVYIDGWDEWQEGDWKVGERVARVRNRDRGVTPAVTVTVTPDVTVAVTDDRLSAGAGGSAGISGALATPDAQALWYDFKGGQVSERALAFVRDLQEQFGDDRLVPAMTAEYEAAGRKVDREFLSRVKGRLLIDGERKSQAAEKRRQDGELAYQRSLAEGVERMTPEQRARAEQIKAGISDFLKGSAA